MNKAEIQTEKGMMKVSFYEADAPKTVANLSNSPKQDFTTDSRFTGLSRTS